MGTKKQDGLSYREMSKPIMIIDSVYTLLPAVCAVTASKEEIDSAYAKCKELADKLSMHLLAAKAK